MIKLVLLLPLLSSIISGFMPRKLKDCYSTIISSFLLLATACIATIAFYHVIFEHKIYEEILFTWFNFGDFKTKWTIRVDSLTAVMLIVVTYVSSLVHIYSIGYMHHDKSVKRFMSYLSLFTFFMLVLVTSADLLQLFVGWEGVGLCSYLLIGFWFHKESANRASIKAFLVNRVGDIGLALGIFTIYMFFGTINFAELFSILKEYPKDAVMLFLGYEVNVLELICILLFIGSMGKSAQLGLHTWLPDAMEGPTPVSALIHAATMVTAGVFLVVRMSPMFELTVHAKQLVTIVGALTCLFAASIALVQNDIKRIIAYSTCSQLGYMFFACGVSAYSAAIFHLATHAFFKALLFLGAGSVIHAMSDEQDIRKMGDLWKKIPFTYTMMWIGSLALAGVFPLAGYYSKDLILEAAYASGTEYGHFAFNFGLVAALFTAFYSWRLIIYVFHGEKRYSDEVDSVIHESPKSMTIPLFILSIGAVFAGVVGQNLLSMVSSDYKFWNGAIVDLSGIIEKAHHVPQLIKFIPLLAGVAGILLAYFLYFYARKLPTLLSEKLSVIYKFLLNKWYVDELYEIIFIKPYQFIAKICWKILDIKVIDNMGPNGAAYLSTKLSNILSKMHTGIIYHYAALVVLAVVIFINLYILVV